MPERGSPDPSAKPVGDRPSSARQAAETGRQGGAAPDKSLSNTDHRLLEETIRRSVSNAVSNAHPELGGNGSARKGNGSANGGTQGRQTILLHEDSDEAARLPGAAKAIAFREKLARSLIDPDPRHHREMIAELEAARIPIQTLAVQLFVPVASRLGEMWCTDEADFIQVAVASTRLNVIINHLGNNTTPTVKRPDSERRVLLARTPDTRHTLGISVVAACFRDMGWIVDGGSDLELDDAVYDRLSASPYNLLGLSVGTVTDAPQCESAIERLRASPATEQIKIALGGPGVTANRSVFETMGADIIATSALDALDKAEKLCS